MFLSEKELRFLGHVIFGHENRIDSKKLLVIKNWSVEKHGLTLIWLTMALVNLM